MDGEVERILGEAASAESGPDPRLVERISASIAPRVKPVRPVAADWVLAAWATLICALVAMAGALALGPRGIEKMGTAEIACIFPALGLATWTLAQWSTRAMRPGAMAPGLGASIPAGLLPVMASALLIAVFAICFREYHLRRFVAQGVICLRAGVIFSALAGAGIAWVMRRGYAVSRAAAGVTMGTLASFAGVTMLELHCDDFQAPHVMVWHVGVVVVCGVVGWGVGRVSPWGRR